MTGFQKDCLRAAEAVAIRKPRKMCKRLIEGIMDKHVEKSDDQISAEICQQLGLLKS